MAWQTVITSSIAASLTTEAVFQDGTPADLKTELNPGETAHVMVKADMGATDDVKFSIYGSDLAAPGAVPDAGQTLAGSDWHLITEITVDNVNDDNEWQGLLVSGYRWFAVTAQRVGTTDTGITAALRIAKDGVNAS